MDTTSDRLAGQLAFPPGGAAKSPSEGLSEGLKQGENPPVFLIHTAKAGGWVASPSAPSACDEKKSRHVSPFIDCTCDEQAREDEASKNLPSRLEKYARQTADAVKFGNWLVDQGKRWERYRPIGRRVASCGSHLVFHDYYDANKVKLVDANNCCAALLCPFCAGRRAVNHLRNTIPKLRAVLKEGAGLVPYLLTITIKDEARCRDMYHKLRGLWSKVIQLRREARKGKRVANAWGKIEGGIMSFEVKRGSGSGLWHIHGHALVVGPPGLVGHEFQLAWSEVVGYWAQADLRSLSCSPLLAVDPDSAETEKVLAKDLMEVFKYALKFNAMTFDDRFQAYRDLVGERLVRSFGAMRGVVLEDEFTDDITDLANQPYYRLVYAAMSTPTGDRGYALRRSQRFEGVEGETPVNVINMDVDLIPSIDGDHH